MAPTVPKSPPGKTICSPRPASATELGGIAYHYVSDLYIALFSRFIPCGAWEAIYIIDGLLANVSDVKPSTIHADTQGQSFPVVTLARLFGFDLMPRIRHWKDLIFVRHSADVRYSHIEALFGETGRNVIDWALIEKHFQDLMRVAISIKEGRLNSVTMLRRLTSNSRRNEIYKAFREVGRSVRTVQLLRFLADAGLRRRVSAATNKAESYNGYTDWLRFGNAGVLASNDPAGQEKMIKFTSLRANCAIFQTAVDMSQVIRGLIGRAEHFGGGYGEATARAPRGGTRAGGAGLTATSDNGQDHGICEFPWGLSDTAPAMRPGWARDS